jgi:hypothetical protein
MSATALSVTDRHRERSDVTGAATVMMMAVVPIETRDVITRRRLAAVPKTVCINEAPEVGEIVLATEAILVDTAKDQLLENGGKYASAPAGGAPVSRKAE